MSDTQDISVSGTTLECPGGWYVNGTTLIIPENWITETDTSFAEIVSEAMLYIDDIRLVEHFQISPAEFYRKMSNYILAALPMLTRPPELYQTLRDSMVLPVYDSCTWVSTEESMTQETVVDTDMPAYQLCSVTVRSGNPAGGIYYLPYNAPYDSTTGYVTFPQQTAAGIEYNIDCYSDGKFAKLTSQQMRLFAMAIAIVWDQRFERDWLNITQKVKDNTFETVNEGNYMEKGSQRLQRNIAAFNDALRHYEQNCAYENARSTGTQNTTLV